MRLDNSFASVVRRGGWCLRRASKGCRVKVPTVRARADRGRASVPAWEKRARYWLDPPRRRLTRADLVASTSHPCKDHAREMEQPQPSLARAASWPVGIVSGSGGRSPVASVTPAGANAFSRRLSSSGRSLALRWRSVVASFEWPRKSRTNTASEVRATRLPAASAGHAGARGAARRLSNRACSAGEAPMDRDADPSGCRAGSR